MCRLFPLLFTLLWRLPQYNIFLRSSDDRHTSAPNIGAFYVYMAKQMHSSLHISCIRASFGALVPLVIRPIDSTQFLLVGSAIDFTFWAIPPHHKRNLMVWWYKRKLLSMIFPCLCRCGACRKCWPNTTHKNNFTSDTIWWDSDGIYSWKRPQQQLVQQNRILR